MQLPVRSRIFTVVLAVVATALFMAVVASGRNAPAIKWQFGATDSVVAKVLVRGNAVYAAAVRGDVYALSAVTGQVLWHRNVGSPVVNELAVDDGRLYVPIENTGIQSFDRKTGDPKWTLKARTDLESGPVLVGNDLFYVDAGVLYAVNRRTHREHWRHDPKSWSGAPPDGHIIVATNGLVCWDDFGTVYGLDAKTGREVWSHREGDLNCTIVGYGGRQLAIFQHARAAETGSLALLDAISGRCRWTATLDGTPLATVDEAGDVFAVLTSKKVVCLDARDGKIRWVHTVQSCVKSAPTLTKDGGLLLGGPGDTVCCLDTRTGNEVWRQLLAVDAYFGFAAEMVGSPTVGPNGKIYVGSDDENVYCISER